ncbi:MAG TPA: glutamyl-tRNA reductase [Negativicutes bacterium]|nr:glutamyl-tRNA reductase [Negativicutes bacterium]
MNIRMIGIDHEKATLREREIFAFTATQCREAMKTVIERYGVNGCVIISTCNRTELWISEADESCTDLKGILYSLKHVENEGIHKYDHLLVVRYGRKACLHLFQTTCGLKSQIWGESQILSQVRKSIEEAREAGTADIYLEKLFQMAVTSAKKIKTNIRLTTVDVSVATKAMERISEVFTKLDKKRCLVIGNGEMGRLMAEQLVKSGAEVFMTLRQYKYESCILPEHCTGVEYDKRYFEMIDMDLVVSATSSPHYTIRAQDFGELVKDNEKSRLLIDLAVPRDIEPEVQVLKNVTLVDMDSMGMGRSELMNQSDVAKALKIIDEYIEEFFGWSQFRDCLPILKSITNSTTQRICRNLSKELEELNMDEREKSLLQSRLSHVADKAVSMVLYGIKDSIDKEAWEACFANIERAVR